MKSLREIDFQFDEDEARLKELVRNHLRTMLLHDLPIDDELADWANVNDDGDDGGYGSFDYRMIMNLGKR